MLAFIPTNRLGGSEILRAWRLSVSLLLTWAGVQAIRTPKPAAVLAASSMVNFPQEVQKEITRFGRKPDHPVQPVSGVRFGFMVRLGGRFCGV